MNRSVFRRAPFLLLIPFAIVAMAAEHHVPQESDRTVDHPGEFTKLLSPGNTDRWIFEGNKDETIIVEVGTREFDSVVQLVQTVGDEEKILHKVDDEGSNCRMMFRLPEKGEYKICVHGFQNKGGGNYSLSIRQYQPYSKEFGATVSGKFDRDGLANFYFESAVDQSLTVDAQGHAVRNWTVLDSSRNAIGTWERLVKFDQAGVRLIELTGQPDQEFGLTLRPVLRHQWTDEKSFEGSLTPRHAMIIDLVGEIGASRMIELESPNGMKSQIAFAPTEAEKGERLNRENNRPVLQLLPVASKGNFTRYAALWGRSARYQMWIYAEKGGSYVVRNSELTTSIAADETRPDKLAVGGTRFYRLQPEQVQSFTLKTRTENFDPVMRLFDQTGHQISMDDDGLDGLNSRMTHTAYNTQPLLFSVSSMGDGGGGDFELDIHAEETNRLVLNKRQTHKAGEVGTDHWTFSGKKGQTIIFHASGEKNLPDLVLRDSSGESLSSSGATYNANDCVMLYKFRHDGEYSVWVSLANREQYSLKAMEAD